MSLEKRAIKGIDVLCYHILFSMNYVVVAVVQLLNHVQLFATPWTATCQAPLSFTISQSFFKFMSIESTMNDRQSFKLVLDKNCDLIFLRISGPLSSVLSYVPLLSSLLFLLSSFSSCPASLLCFSSIWKHILESLNMVSQSSVWKWHKHCWLKQLEGKSFPTVPPFSEPCFFS